jgi:hypothetical protein
MEVGVECLLINGDSDLFNENYLIMEIAVHITFFFDKNRIPYLETVLSGIDDFNIKTSVYIYTNTLFKTKKKYKNINIHYKRFLYLKKFRWRFNYNHIFNKIGLKFLIHPFFLSWESRKIIEKIKYNFNYQIYIEDDILFSKENFEYWKKYKDECINSGYNLGFLRYEIDCNKNLFYSDLWIEKPKKFIKLNNTFFLVNDLNPYCALWIYDKKELFNFIDSEEWKFKFEKYGIREKSAIGWHGKGMSRYKFTIIPLINVKGKYIIDQNCLVHHLPNNYIGHKGFCTVKHPIEYDYRFVEENIIKAY